jgi:ADP-ribosylglycohydrolase
MAASTDRIVGALLGMACGDALGAGYEFTNPGPDAPISMKGGGGFGWEPGEWTDDTQMAICIAGEAATGHLESAAVGERFLDWIRSEPTDVGVMTRAVLSAASTGKDLPAAAKEYCRAHPRCAGNGSLMRTAPVALAHLGDREAIVAAARRWPGMPAYCGAWRSTMPSTTPH